MRTLAILVVTLLSQNATLDAAYNASNSTITPNTENQTMEEPSPTPQITNEVTTVPATGKNSTATTVVSSQPTLPPTGMSESRSPTKVTRFSKTSSPPKTIASANNNSGSKYIVIVILLVIFLGLVLAGGIHAWWNRRSTQDDCTPRLLLSIRETLRAGINNIGDRTGVVLWPGGKREGEDEEDEEVEGKREDVEEGGQERDNDGNSNGNDRSDSSDDYSSLEEKDLGHMALSGQEDEANKQSVEGDGAGEKMPNSGRHSPALGQENGQKEEGLEEVALINSPTEEDENAELCDETIF